MSKEWRKRCIWERKKEMRNRKMFSLNCCMDCDERQVNFVSPVVNNMASGDCHVSSLFESHNDLNYLPIRQSKRVCFLQVSPPMMEMSTISS